MQPPPRKVKVTQELKNTHTDQMTRLHFKHQTECDLLEDMRSYSLKKGQLERDYAQALQKLASQYLKRDWPGINPDDQRTDYRNVYAVWRSYLEGTVQVSQSRLNVCDNYKSQVSEPAKTVRLYKEQQLKKTIDQLSGIQAELQESVKELAKAKKKYYDCEQVAHAVREKADIEAKSKLGLFQSRISLQKASVKLKAKRSDCNSKATQARNDYLLTLAAANAHHDRYYHTDLLHCIQALDGRIYEHVKDYLVALCRTELEASQATHNTFQFLLDKSTRIIQEFNQQLFMQENPVFHKAHDFQFQPSECDTTLSSVQQLVDIEPSPVSAMRMTLAQSRQLESETGTTEEHSLNKEARKWATRVAREHKNIIHYKRSLEECESHGLPPTEQGRADLEMKIEDTKENIRKAETIKLKAEARLDLLRQVGVAVDTWLKSAMNQVMEELENERWASYTSHDPSLSGTVDLEREEGEECEENMEVFDDSSSSPSGTLRNYPLTCKVLYSYKASQPDELTIDEQEMLEVIEDGDMEDWVKARNKTGQVGYVPEKYLQFPTSNSLLSMLQSLATLDARSHTSSNSTEPELHSGCINGDTNMVYVRALYDYEGQADEELSFSEGAVIRLLSRDTQTDDGFWEGELNGRVGVFPSVLVEDLTENGETSGGGAGDIQVQEHHQISPSLKLPSSLPPLPLYDQPPISPFTSPETSTPPPLPRSPSAALNGEHKHPLPTSSHKGPKATHNQSSGRSPVSPGFPQTQPLRFTPEGGPGKLRPVRAAPPPPKQHPRRQQEKSDKTEEVEITLV
ncbi:F-BAR and double SH3 domains protein 2-like isoform X1 [Thunnus albacares]|uniref:F-BAR and double SH3 domains protein 2-like isoform X1 n=2 Tax=Thunnus maccoyii TaxID=8240 RepID=UPI001C4B83C3|nr:F-BAR and double SH3 domains protein 2-like isoform X1 [Thunnus maccoyii]XP_044209949.1 F-BAR and double SH3 domains protein 2-like isoform X1 [Thunnus albacares]